MAASGGQQKLTPEIDGFRFCPVPDSSSISKGRGG